MVVNGEKIICNKSQNFKVRQVHACTKCFEVPPGKLFLGVNAQYAQVFKLWHMAVKDYTWTSIIYVLIINIQ